MLGKIIKYDIKATARYFIPMYVGLAILTLFNKLFLELLPFRQMDDSIFFNILNSIRTIFLTLYILYIIAAVIMTMVIIVVHFYKNMTGDEAYLTFTLPVKTTSLVNGKLIVATMWTLLTGIFCILSVGLLVAGHGYISEFFDVMGQMFRELGASSYRGEIISISVVVLILCFISLLSGTLMTYASMALGHLFGKHRIIGSIVCYIGFNVGSQMIMTITLLISSLSQYSNRVMFDEFYPSFMAMMIISTIVTAAITAAYYFITVYVFSKKLNLE